MLKDTHACRGRPHEWADMMRRSIAHGVVRLHHRTAVSKQANAKECDEKNCQKMLKKRHTKSIPQNQISDALRAVSVFSECIFIPPPPLYKFKNACN